jgi:tRNA pseudouridine38-40 synthase
MRNILLTIEYDGTSFSGWQRQSNGRSIQGEIEKTLYRMTKEPDVKLFGSGRTDAGVHALAQKANFKTNCNIPISSVPDAMNSIMSDDIFIVEAKEVFLSFDARKHAKSKAYLYRIRNSERNAALDRHRVYCIPQKLDISRMSEAASYFIGEHDFTSFCSAKSLTRTKVRTVFSVDIFQEKDDIKILVVGSGFLYNMVRVIVGTLIDVGHEKIHPSDILSILNKKDRTEAGRTAPSHGLYLQEVQYDMEKFEKSV